MPEQSIHYTISPTEIKRREDAYLTLMISLLVSLTAALWIWAKNYIILLYILPIILLFFLSILIFKKFFKNYAKNKISLTEELIERCGYKVSEKIFFKDIKSIAIRYTTRGLIRDIIITAKDKTLALDGLENFQEFKTVLIAKNPNIQIKESHEHLDYDHLFFYPILGILVGFILPSGIIYLAFTNINWITLAISIYVIIVGLFFLVNRPIGKRYGDKKPLADTIFGAILLISGFIIYFLSK